MKKLLISLSLVAAFSLTCCNTKPIDIPQKEETISAEGSNVYGRVVCGGKPLAGVVVSDGYEVVATGGEGVYRMSSKKANGYVFISIPSGYEVASKGVLPLFSQKLLKRVNEVERVDFELAEAPGQEKHTMLYFGDIHLASRTNDRAQFAEFTAEINDYLKSHEGERIYAMTLGDMTWDQFWYKNNYDLNSYLKEIGVIRGLQIFHTIGNHDHDMNAVGDWDTVKRYKEVIAPNYYSFNIGSIHYVVLDDIECTNKRASTTDASVRTYNNAVVKEDLDWLAKDLAFVPKTTPVVLVMHSPLFNKDAAPNLLNTKDVVKVLDGYDVTVVSGHSHIIHNVTNGKISEHNSGAVCAAWWWAGMYTGLNWATDGAPAGYRVTSVSGKEQTSYFKGTGIPAEVQFRSYDRNEIFMNGTRYGLSNATTEALVKEAYDRGGYNMPSTDNQVLINVWDYDPSWKVEVSENGKALEVKQLKNAYDPGFLIAYTIPQLKKNSQISWRTTATNHIFSVFASSPSSTLEIKVTDDEGRVYTETMARPKAFELASYR